MSEDIFSIDASTILERGIDESNRLEYKDVRADKQNVVEELTALANTDGGRILYGVREDGGEVVEIQNVTGFSEWEEGINQVLAMRTDPTVSADVNKIDHEGNTIVELSVEHRGVLHTYQPDNNKPYVPVRVGTTTDFLSGSAIREFYRSNFEGRSIDSSISELRDEMRRKAHRVVYTFEKSDFGEVEDRVSFTLMVKGVTEELEEKLAEPHKHIEENTMDLIKEVVRAGQNLQDSQTRVSRSGVYSLGDRPVERGYTEDSPEEVERKYRKAALEFRESAMSLQQYLT